MMEARYRLTERESEGDRERELGQRWQGRVRGGSDEGSSNSRDTDSLRSFFASLSSLHSPAHSRSAVAAVQLLQLQLQRRRPQRPEGLCASRLESSPTIDPALQLRLRIQQQRRFQLSSDQQTTAPQREEAAQSSPPCNDSQSPDE